MSGQLLELLIFAGIAIFLINKLVSMLGSTTEDDPSKSFRNKSFFGHFGDKSGNKNINSVVSDITNGNPSTNPPKFSKIDFPKQDGFIVKGKEKDILEGFNMLLLKLPSFDLVKFHKNSKIAFDLIIKAGIQNNEDELQELIDPRYIDHFKDVAVNYTKLVENETEIKYEISEIYMFGNTVFIKVMFTKKGDEELEDGFNEEWTFSRSILTEGKTWYLSNIDKI